MVSFSFILTILALSSPTFLVPLPLGNPQSQRLWQQVRRPITSIKLAITKGKQRNALGDANSFLYNPKIERYEARLQSSPFQKLKDASHKAGTQVRQSMSSFENHLKYINDAGYAKMSNGLTKAGKSLNTLGAGVKQSFQKGVNNIKKGLTKESIQSTYQTGVNNVKDGLSKAGQSISNFGTGVKNSFQSVVNRGREKFHAKLEPYQPILKALKDVRQGQTWKKRENEFQSLAKKFESKPSITPSEKSILEAMASKLGLKDRLKFLEGRTVIPEPGLGIRQRLNNHKINNVNNKWGERPVAPSVAPSNQASIGTQTNPALKNTAPNQANIGNRQRSQSLSFSNNARPSQALHNILSIASPEVSQGVGHIGLGTAHKPILSYTAIRNSNSETPFIIGV